MNVPRIDVGMPTDIPLADDDAPASEGWFQGRRDKLTQSRMRRLERDAGRGYSINVKQVVLAFAVEFWIIGLIVLGTYLLIAESASEHVSREAVFSALLLPAALAMVELAYFSGNSLPARVQVGAILHPFDGASVAAV